MKVFRPVAKWAREIEEMGFVLSDDSPGNVVWYAIFEGDIVAQLIPDAERAGWQLAEVGVREKPIIYGRYPDRKLRFPDAPVETLWKPEPGPHQTLEVSRIKLAYTGKDGNKLMKRKGQVLSGDWDLEAAPRAAVAGAVDEARSDAPLKVGISRQGRYIVVDGHSQLARAERDGAKEIDAEIVVRHPDWEKFREACIRHAGDRKGLIYQKLLHPDLSDLEAGHVDDRLPILKKALAGVNPAGKKLLDIGSHWGMISRMMEDLGFDVTAVEHSPAGAKTARRLRDATESRYQIWEGSIFEFPEIEQQNIILGLNIFHHFLKRKETYDGLVSILERSKADIIIFAAHVYGRGKDFVGAYTDFPPDEFAKFVSKHSRLPNYEHVGTTHDGRRMYKLWK